MQSDKILLSLLFMALSWWSEVVYGHGRLLDPPGRSTMWRSNFSTPKNYNDNELYCGGFTKQKNFGGKCGICGDPYDQNPRENEAGGKYATGIISKVYNINSTINVTVQITANHLGYFEFRLCKNNNINKKITEECLQLLNHSLTGETRHYINSTIGNIIISLNLPKNMTCTQCVLQWRYHTENRWGVDEDGKGCLGCGPQEEFYACSDIAIVDSGKTTTSVKPVTESDVTKTTLSDILRSSTTSSPTIKTAQTTTDVPDTTTTEVNNTSPQTNPTSPIITTKSRTTLSKILESSTPTTITTRVTETTTTLANGGTLSASKTTLTTQGTQTSTTTATQTSNRKKDCVSISLVTTNSWCNENCNHTPSFCPSEYCQCSS